MVRHSHSRYARGVSADGRVQPPTIRRYDISTYLCSKHQRTCVRKREPRKQWTRTDDVPMTVKKYLRTVHHVQLIAQNGAIANDGAQPKHLYYSMQYMHADSGGSWHSVVDFRLSKLARNKQSTEIFSFLFSNRNTKIRLIRWIREMSLRTPNSTIHPK